MKKAARSFRELDVYRKGRQEAKKIFLVTKTFPKEEIYSLTDQVRRSSRAVTALIAEAWGRRRYPTSFANKLSDAHGEAMETQSWLDHALDCEYISAEQFAEMDDAWQHIGAMLSKMIDKAEEFCKNVKR
jgi:four helix bundle protein